MRRAWLHTRLQALEEGRTPASHAQIASDEFEIASTIRDLRQCRSLGIAIFWVMVRYVPARCLRQYGAGNPSLKFWFERLWFSLLKPLIDGLRREI
jgi:hypothetical protein